MIQPIQIILIVFVLFALSRAYLRYKEGKIKKGEFFFWFIVWIAAIIAIALPESLRFLSDYLGIGRPVDLIIYVAIILLFYLCFRLYVALDNVEQSITKVVREVAIKEKRQKK
jgi:hypothetical protein